MSLVIMPDIEPSTLVIVVGVLSLVLPRLVLNHEIKQT